jgi:predicted ferric reductase
MKKFIFFTIWVVLLILVPITVFKTTPLVMVTKYPVTISNFLQRSLGLTLFILLFVQIIIGAFMSKLTNKLGGWLFNFHVFEGKLIYFLAFLHPVFFVLFNYYVGAKLDPYAAFINVCVLCKYPIDYYYTLGRISFWLLTVAVFAAVFRNSTVWLKKNWRNLHVINYVVFLLVGAHGFLLGTDFRIMPFYGFAVLAYMVIAGIVIFIGIPRLYRNFRVWVQER